MTHSPRFAARRLPVSGAPPFRCAMPDSKKDATNRLAALRAVRNAYGPEAEARKQALIAALAAQPPRTAGAIVRFHEDLLFIRAFPGDRRTLRDAVAALPVVEKVFLKLPAGERATRDETGMAGSKTHYTLPYVIVRWLIARVAPELDFDWRDYDATRLDLLLRTAMRMSEREGFDSAEFATRAWMRAARRSDAHTELQSLVGALAARRNIQAAIDDMWTSAEPPIVWNLAGSRFSSTYFALRAAPLVLRSKMRKPPPDPARHIATPLKTVRLLSPKEARPVIAATRASLAVRGREVAPITYANPEEVHWCDLGEGAALAVLGVEPAQRMNIEANYGYLLVSNGVPIGYGGVTPLFRQANTGINIFDPFRGSEAAFLWTEMLRAFHTLFGVGRFIVNGYQFGEGNSEAINSGAYWFYHRLGFRPSTPRLRKLAEREAARLSRPGAAKSSKAVLKALAEGDLYLDLPGFDEADHFDEALLPHLGAAAARILSAEPVASRAEAEARIAERLAPALGVKSMHAWTAAERRGFARLAPVVSIVGEVSGWPDEDKRGLVAMLRAKGSPQESDFAQAARRTPRFFRSLRDELKRET